jgi:hypothetical protein
VEREGRAPQRIADGCTLHAGEPFTAICRQCGTYMCRRCGEDGQFDRCPDCRQQGARALGPAPANAPAPTAAPAPSDFPFRRDGIEWGRFLRYCFEVYTKNFGLLTLAMIACFGAPIALEFAFGALTLVSDDPAFGFGIMAVLGIGLLVLMSLLVLGVLNISLHVARGQPAELSLLWRSVPRLAAFLLVSAAMGAALLGIEALLAMVFGLGFASLDSADWTLGTLMVGLVLGIAGLAASAYVSLGLVFACVEIVAEPEISAFGALKNAWSIARGERLTLGFGLFLISMLLFAGLLMCGIGVIFTLGFASVLFASLYLALRNGAPLDPR